MKNNKNQDFEPVSDEITAEDIKELKEKMLSSLSPPLNMQSDEKNKPMKTRSKERKSNNLSIPLDILILIAGVLIIIAIYLYFSVNQQEEKLKQKQKEKQKIEHERAPEPYDPLKNPNIRWV